MENSSTGNIYPDLSSTSQTTQMNYEQSSSTSGNQSESRYRGASSTNEEKPCSSSSQSTSSSSATGSSGSGGASGGSFDCNICLEPASDAVISLCGHLFCWPCLHQWLETRPNRKLCPVCKAGISKDNVVPLYGRGGSSSDPREKVPPRPQGHRPEPTNNGNQSPFGFGDGGGGFQMSFGIGAFPFGFFMSNFNMNNPQPPPMPGTPQHEEEQFLAKIFLWVALLFGLWLLIS